MNLTNEHLSMCKALLDQLEATGPESFNLDHWYEYRSLSTGAVIERSLMSGLDDVIDFNRCGTTACIAGHALLALDADQIGQLVADLEADDSGTADEELVRQTLAEMLGMDVNRDVANYELTSWFFGTWPRWAAERLDTRYLLHVSAGESSTVARHHAEYDVVLGAVDEIVHGMRLDWWTPLDAEPTEHAIEYVDSSW